MLFSIVAAIDYLVQYQEGSNVQADIVIGNFKASLKSMTADQKLKLNKDVSVKRIEQNGVMRAFGTQKGATWGLDRIDSRTGLDQEYNFPDTSGSGVTAYVIDTGIFTDHEEFEGRARFGFDSTGEGSADGNGHGTHCAGTIGGKTYGVAKNVELVAVRVLDSQGSGTYEGVIKGIEWAVADAQKSGKAKSKKAVANMSLGGGKSQVVNDAVKAAVEAGLIMVVAAGNDGSDACNTSPASEPLAITVGASDKTDSAAYFSNYGPCVDVFGPGVDITSSWNTDKTAINTISGTSMATPHTVGVVALYLGLGVTDIDTVLKESSTRDVLKKMKKGTLNLFIYNQPTPSNPGEPIPTPTDSEPEEPCEKPWYCEWLPDRPECQC